jgi:hypothetical protein
MSPPVFHNSPEACATIQNTATVCTTPPLRNNLDVALANITIVSSSPAVLLMNLHFKACFVFTGTITPTSYSEPQLQVATHSLQ